MITTALFTLGLFFRRGLLYRCGTNQSSAAPRRRLHLHRRRARSTAAASSSRRSATPSKCRPSGRASGTSARSICAIHRRARLVRGRPAAAHADWRGPLPPTGKAAVRELDVGKLGRIAAEYAGARRVPRRDRRPRAARRAQARESGRHRGRPPGVRRSQGGAPSRGGAPRRRLHHRGQLCLWRRRRRGGRRGQRRRRRLPPITPEGDR